MGRKKSRKATKANNLTIDRKRRSGHYQGTNYSDVYKDGKAHVYTAWNDNEDDEGATMEFEAWASHYTSANGKKRRRK